MDVGLGWLGVGIGLAGCIAALVMSGARPGEVPGEQVIRTRTRMAVGLTVILTIIVWAIAMQTRPPFSLGQGLAFGFLIGGLTGAAALILSCTLGLRIIGDNSERRKLLSNLSIAFLALFGTALTYVIFRGYPQPALIGFMIAAAMAAILHYYTQDADSAQGSLVLTWAVAAILIAAGTLLAVEHFGQTAQRTWWALPILMVSTVLIATYIGAELLSSGRRVLGYLIGPVIVLILSALYSWRLVADWMLLAVTAVGIAITAIIAWLVRGPEVGDESSGGLDIASICVLLVVAFVVATFTLWAGLGIAVGLVAGLSVGLLATGSSGRVFRDAISLALVILLFKLFVEMNRSSLGGADMRVHYTFIGALLGAVLPFMFVSALVRSRNGDARTLVSVAFIGLVAAAAPLLLCLVWGIKSVLGFAFGLPAAMAFMLLANMSGDRERPAFGAYSIALLAIGAELMAVEFSSTLAVVEMTRAVRIAILGGVVIIAAAWSALSARRSA